MSMAWTRGRALHTAQCNIPRAICWYLLCVCDGHFECWKFRLTFAARLARSYACDGQQTYGSKTQLAIVTLICAPFNSFLFRSIVVSVLFLLRGIRWTLNTHKHTREKERKICDEVNIWNVWWEFPFVVAFYSHLRPDVVHTPTRNHSTVITSLCIPNRKYNYKNMYCTAVHTCNQ